MHACRDRNVKILIFAPSFRTEKLKRRGVHSRVELIFVRKKVGDERAKDINEKMLVQAHC